MCVCVSVCLVGGGLMAGKCYRLAEWDIGGDGGKSADEGIFCTECGG